MGSRWSSESSPVALTMLSRRGRSEGGALWGRRYVKKNLRQRETGGSVVWPLGTHPFSVSAWARTPIWPGKMIPQVYH